MEVALGEIGGSKISPVKVRLFEIGTFEVRSFEIRSLKPRPFKVAFSQVGPLKVGGPFEVSSLQVGSYQFDLFEVGCEEVRASEIGLSENGSSKLGECDTELDKVAILGDGRKHRSHHAPHASRGLSRFDRGRHTGSTGDCGPRAENQQPCQCAVVHRYLQDGSTAGVPSNHLAVLHEINQELS